MATVHDDVKTIRDRTISIRLSDADCVRLAEKAGAVGLSVGDLLKFFVNDLVCGCQSNGSDERDLAGAWFERCGFEQVADNTFLRWLLNQSDVREFVGHYDLMKECEEELESGELDDPREAVEDELEYQKNWVDDAYHEYATGWGSEKWVEPFDAAVERVLKWDKELQALKGSLGMSVYERYLAEKSAMVDKIFASQEAAPLSEPDYEPEM